MRDILGTRDIWDTIEEIYRLRDMCDMLDNGYWIRNTSHIMRTRDIWDMDILDKNIEYMGC